MSATIYYTEEVVGQEIKCDCGYEGGYHDYIYGDFGEDASEPWTCPDCGKTFALDEDWI